MEICSEIQPYFGLMLELGTENTNQERMQNPDRQSFECSGEDLFKENDGA